MELTFNLNQLLKQDLQIADLNLFKKLHDNPNREEWKILFKPHELEHIYHSSITITSRDLREFLDDIFGIEMGIEHSSNRNRLNEIIKKHAPTQRGKRTKLNYYQFRDLILSDDFNKFILKNHDDFKSNNPKRMYQEIMYLQNNKFKESPLYLEQKKKDIVYYANALSLLDGFDQILKNYYWAFLDLWHNHKIPYNKIMAPKEDIQMLDIISYRFRSTSNNIYKFTSKEDVFSTNKNQIIEWFLQDVDRWANEKNE